MTETDPALEDAPDAPDDHTEDAPLIDDLEPGQAGAETDPEAETPAGTEPKP